MQITVDYDAVTQVVLRAGQLFSDQEKKSDILEKGRADFVTQVDFAVQRFIFDNLGALYPEIQFLGEEGRKEELDWTQPMWILDPVDGTTNLIRDMQMSVISLALWDGEGIAYGCIYQPYRSELCTAVRGQGTKLNGKPVHVSQAKDVAHSLFAIGSSPYEKDEYADLVFAKMKKLFLAGLDFRRTASAAMDLMYVAIGRFDGYFEHYLKPWDCAAGMLLVKEAGGTITDFEGKSIVPGDYPDVVASNGKIHKEFLELMRMEDK